MNYRGEIRFSDELGDLGGTYRAVPILRSIPWHVKIFEVSSIRNPRAYTPRMQVSRTDVFYRTLADCFFPGEMSVTSTRLTLSMP